MVNRTEPLPVRRQCELLDLPRSTFYYQPQPVPEGDLDLMRTLDECHLQRPFYGSRRLRDWLEDLGYVISRKKVQRLMRTMGLTALYPKRNLSKRHQAHTVYPYLLRGLVIDRPNQVWAADVTYIPMAKGFLYLVAIIDWYSRYVLAWGLSNTLDTGFCLQALEAALSDQQPCVFNTDQGAQFTSSEFTDRLKAQQILISMDGRGRALDNVFIERLWRTLKYEDIYLRDYKSVPELHQGLTDYLRFYNHQRPHSALGGKTPAEVHWASLPTPN